MRWRRKNVQSNSTSILKYLSMCLFINLIFFEIVRLNSHACIFHVKDCLSADQCISAIGLKFYSINPTFFCIIYKFFGCRKICKIAANLRYNIYFSILQKHIHPTLPLKPSNDLKRLRITCSHFSALIGSIHPQPFYPVIICPAHFRRIGFDRLFLRLPCLSYIYKKILGKRFLTAIIVASIHQYPRYMSCCVQRGQCKVPMIVMNIMQPMRIYNIRLLLFYEFCHRSIQLITELDIERRKSPCQQFITYDFACFNRFPLRRCIISHSFAIRINKTRRRSNKSDDTIPFQTMPCKGAATSKLQIIKMCAYCQNLHKCTSIKQSCGIFLPAGLQVLS